MSSQSRNLVIAGAGGLGSEAAWVAACMQGWNVLGFIDENVQLRGFRFSGHPVIGPPEYAADLFREQAVWYSCTIGNNANRAKLAAALDAIGWQAASLIHPSATVADSAVIGVGVYIGAGAVVCPNARIGNHVIVNTHASVGHDAVLEDFVQVCPGARISGNCHIGTHAFVGSNAVVLPGVAVGTAAVVAACSQVIRRVPAEATVVGVPARCLCMSNENRERKVYE